MLSHPEPSFLIYYLDIKFVVDLIMFENVISKWKDKVMTQILLQRDSNPKNYGEATWTPQDAVTSELQR